MSLLWILHYYTNVYHAPGFPSDGQYKNGCNKILADSITKGLLFCCTAESNRGKHLLLVSRNNWHFEVELFMLSITFLNLLGALREYSLLKKNLCGIYWLNWNLTPFLYLICSWFISKSSGNSLEHFQRFSLRLLWKCVQLDFGISLITLKCF